MGILSGLQPEKVFSYFEKLCSVPHGSGNTKIISDMCVDFAKELGLKYRQDAVNNVIIWKNGSMGYENAAPVILQGHIDMVCAKTDDCSRHCDLADCRVSFGLFLRLRTYTSSNNISGSGKYEREPGTTG